MGHHIDAEGRFQSDKYPDLGPDKIVVSFKHPQARGALLELARGYEGADPVLATDIRARLQSLDAEAEAARRASIPAVDLEEEQRQAAKMEYALHAEFLAVATEMLSGLDAESQRRAYEPCSSFAKLRALRILSVLLRRAPRKYDVFPTRYAEVAIGTEQAPCRRILILCGRTGGVTCFVSDDHSDSRRAHYDDDTTLPDAFMLDAIRALDAASAGER